MAIYIYKITAVHQAFKLAKGMWVEIVVSGSLRKPTHREITAAFNEKYGEGTAHAGMPTNYFLISEM